MYPAITLGFFPKPLKKHTHTPVLHYLSWQNSLSIHELFHEVGGVAFVVAADEAVGVVHAGAMDSEPVHHPDASAIAGQHLQNFHFFVDIVGITRGRGIESCVQLGEPGHSWCCNALD